MEAVKSGHSFSSTCLTKIDTKLILFSDVMGGESWDAQAQQLAGNEASLLRDVSLVPGSDVVGVQ